MKTIQIQTTQFFELLKLKETSMWEIFSQMIDGEEKQLIFLNENNEILFGYTLPSTLEKLQEDRKIFAEEFSKKLN